MGKFKTAFTTWNRSQIDIASVTQCLTDLGIDYTDELLGHSQDAEFVVERLKDYDYIVAGSERLDASVLPRLPKLKLIARNGAGYDNVDLACAKELGITVAYAPGVNAPWVAEHALTLMLSILRGVGEYSHDIKCGSKVSVSGMTSSLMGCMTVGLVGFGAIARNLNNFLKPFGVHVIAYDPFVSEEAMAERGVKKKTLDELLEQSDVVSMHLPDNAQTHHTADAAFFSKMKNSAVFINTARAGVCDEKALCNALRTGEIAAAGLDVYEDEANFAGMRNTLLTPHIASRSRSCWLGLVGYSARNVAAFHAGQEVSNILTDGRK